MFEWDDAELLKVAAQFRVLQARYPEMQVQNTYVWKFWLNGSNGNHTCKIMPVLLNSRFSWEHTVPLQLGSLHWWVLDLAPSVGAGAGW